VFALSGLGAKMTCRG